jgi:putative DNA primase/helicase
MEEGLRVEVHLTKARGIFGNDAAPFEAQLETKNSAAIWALRGLEDVQLRRARELFADGLTVREVGEELKVGKSTAQRLKSKIAAGNQ